MADAGVRAMMAVGMEFEVAFSSPRPTVGDNVGSPHPSPDPIRGLPMRVESASTVFQVAKIRKAVAFYRDVLGFGEEFLYGDPPFYAGVKRDRAIFHLNASKENEARRGMGSAYVFCDEVDDYYEEVRLKGAEVTSPLNSYPYGMRDFQIADPDGNLVTFGCPIEEGG